MSVSRSGTVPTYHLYGESGEQPADLWFHCETIASRSSLYRWEIGLHRHQGLHQFLYIRDGAGDALIGGDSLPLEPPVIVSVPPRVTHGFRFSKSVDGLVVTLLSDRLDGLLGNGARAAAGGWTAQPLVLPLRENRDAGYLEQTLLRLLHEFDDGRDAGPAGRHAGRQVGGSTLLDAYLRAAILILAKHAGATGDGAPPDGKDRRLEALRTLVARRFREQWTVGDYARALNLSPTHLNRLARERLGMSVHDLIMARVIDEACRSLVFTNASIRAIADELGFADAAYFTRCFRLRTGFTPKAYRDRETGAPSFPAA